MPEHEQARAYIRAMIGHRTGVSEAVRDILHKLLDTLSVRARFPSHTHEVLCDIADSLVEQIRTTPPQKWRRRKPG
jgi:hypothetical protein